MSNDVRPPETADSSPTLGSAEVPADGSRRRRFDPQFDRFSGLYIAIGLFIAYSIWMPDTFGNVNNARVIAASAAITGIIALGATVGLVVGAFDVSIAANMSFAITLVGWLQSVHGVSPITAILLTLLSGVVIGIVNAFVVVGLGVEAVVGTLGTGALLAAMTYWVGGGQTIVAGITEGFTRFGRDKFLTLPLPVFYLAGVALILWYLLEHTPFGRYLYAIGANPNAARLAGLKVGRMKLIAFMISGMLASMAGIVLTMQLGAASYGAGDPYLLPAFAAVFLGATQIRPGRFNIGGTVVALYLLAIGVQGLQLHYPALPWIKDLFQGAVLIVAVALGGLATRRRASKATT